MQQVLNDPQADPVEHALKLTHIIGLTEDGSVEADMLFGDLPAWLAEPLRFESTDEGVAFTTELRANPAALILRITNRAHASISYRNPETGEYLQQQLSRAQQEVLNDYATAAAFHLTGTANGELLTTSPEDSANVANPQYILTQVEEHLEAVAIYAEELVTRAAVNSTSTEEDAPMDLAHSLAMSAEAAAATLSALKALIEADPDQSRWQPMQPED